MSDEAVTGSGDGGEAGSGATLLAQQRYGKSSAGLPLVLLHAFPLDSRMWRTLLPELSDLDVITLDSPGFGRSPVPTAVARGVGRDPEPSLETYADAVAETLRSLGVQRAVVAGLSMGGYAVLALAERHRGLVAGAGLLDTNAHTDDEAGHERRLTMARSAEELVAAGQTAAAVEEGGWPQEEVRASGLAADMVVGLVAPATRHEQPELVDELRAVAAEAPAASVAWAQRAMAQRPARYTALEDLASPVLVLRGAEDATSTQESAQAMVRAAGGPAELVVVPRVGHLSAAEDPASVAAALRVLHERATEAG